MDSSNFRWHWVVLFRILVIYSFNVRSTALAKLRNITIDDQNPSIHYSPPGAWNKTKSTSLDFGGSHMLTEKPYGTASFNFTGVAIYFMSPLWPYTVNTEISLDSGPSTLVDLVDYSRPRTHGGPETVKYHVVWKATGLANTQHHLRISVGVNQPYAIVDGLRYTEVTDVESSPSSSLTPTSTLLASSTSTFSSSIASLIPTFPSPISIITSSISFSTIASSTSISAITSSTSNPPIAPSTSNTTTASSTSNPPIASSASVSATSSLVSGATNTPSESKHQILVTEIVGPVSVSLFLSLLIGVLYVFRRRKGLDSETPRLARRPPDWTIEGSDVAWVSASQIENGWNQTGDFPSPPHGLQPGIRM